MSRQAVAFSIPNENYFTIPPLQLMSVLHYEEHMMQLTSSVTQTQSGLGLCMSIHWASRSYSI